MPPDNEALVNSYLSQIKGLEDVITVLKKSNEAHKKQRDWAMRAGVIFGLIGMVALIIAFAIAPKEEVVSQIEESIKLTITSTLINGVFAGAAFLLSTHFYRESQKLDEQVVDTDLKRKIEAAIRDAADMHIGAMAELGTQGITRLLDGRAFIESTVDLQHPDVYKGNVYALLSREIENATSHIRVLSISSIANGVVYANAKEFRQRYLDKIEHKVANTPGITYQRIYQVTDRQKRQLVNKDAAALNWLVSHTQNVHRKPAQGATVKTYLSTQKRLHGLVIINNDTLIILLSGMHVQGPPIRTDKKPGILNIHNPFSAPDNQQSPQGEESYYPIGALVYKKGIDKSTETVDAYIKVFEQLIEDDHTTAEILPDMTIVERTQR